MLGNKLNQFKKYKYRITSQYFSDSTGFTYSSPKVIEEAEITEENYLVFEEGDLNWYVREHTQQLKKGIDYDWLWSYEIYEYLNGIDYLIPERVVKVWQSEVYD